MKDILSAIQTQERGVYVQASTLGSLEALLGFLKDSKIPVRIVCLKVSRAKPLHFTVQWCQHWSSTQERCDEMLSAIGTRQPVSDIYQKSERYSIYALLGGQLF